MQQTLKSLRSQCNSGGANVTRLSIEGQKQRDWRINPGGRMHSEACCLSRHINIPTASPTPHTLPVAPCKRTKRHKMEQSQCSKVISHSYPYAVSNYLPSLAQHPRICSNTLAWTLAVDFPVVSRLLLRQCNHVHGTGLCARPVPTGS